VEPAMITPEDIKRIVSSDSRLKKEPLAKLTVKSVDGSLRIWNIPDIKNFYENKAMKWHPRHKTAVFIPCSAHKPYFYSQSHKDGYLKALLPYIEDIDLFVVSEPLAIVPYCFSDEYPANSYDYDPNRYFIGKTSQPTVAKALSIFIDRLSRWISKFHSSYSRRILILPRSWHLKAFLKAIRKSGVPPGDYSVVLLKGRPFRYVEDISKQISNYLR
jgi:predicted RNA-binding protein